MPKRKPQVWGRVSYIEYDHAEDGLPYYHDFVDMPLLVATGDGRTAELKEAGLWRRSGPDNQLYFQNPRRGKSTMARRAQRRHKSGPNKGRFMKTAKRKTTAKRRRNSPSKAVAKRRTPRAAAQRAPVRRRRRNPPLIPRNPVKKIMGGLMDAAQVLVGEAGARTIPTMIPGLNKGGNLGLAIQSATALVIGLLADRFAGRDVGRMVLAGGLAAPMKTLIVTNDVPFLGKALSPAQASADLGAYSMGSYPVVSQISRPQLAAYPDAPAADFGTELGGYQEEQYIEAEEY